MVEHKASVFTQDIVERIVTVFLGLNVMEISTIPNATLTAAMIKIKTVSSVTTLAVARQDLAAIQVSFAPVVVAVPLIRLCV